MRIHCCLPPTDDLEEDLVDLDAGRIGAVADTAPSLEQPPSGDLEGLDDGRVPSPADNVAGSSPLFDTWRQIRFLDEIVWLQSRHDPEVFYVPERDRFIIWRTAEYAEFKRQHDRLRAKQMDRDMACAQDSDMATTISKNCFSSVFSTNILNHVLCCIGVNTSRYTLSAKRPASIVLKMFTCWTSSINLRRWFHTSIIMCTNCHDEASKKE